MACSWRTWATRALITCATVLLLGGGVPAASAASSSDGGTGSASRAPIPPRPKPAHALGQKRGTAQPQIGQSSATPAGSTSCTSTTLDLKVLVLAGNGQETDLASIERALDGMGTPYTLWIGSLHPGTLTADQLSNACHGFYQGVILTNGNLGYFDSNGNWVESGLNDTEWSTLAAYEASFSVRRVSWYTYPTPDYGFQWPSDNGIDTSTTPVVGHLTTAGQAIFAYLQPTASVPIEAAWAYLTTAATDGISTPVLSDGNGHALAVDHTYGDGRESLALTFDSSPLYMQHLLLWYGLVNWVTRGLFVGERHTFLAPQVDDFFETNGAWTARQSCTAGNTDGYRMTGADLTAALAFQRAARTNPSFGQLTLTWAFVGEGRSGSPADTLLPAAQANAHAFYWLNHTWDHADLTSVDYPTASNEVTKNNHLSSSLGLTPYNARDLVTPSYSGLHNAAAMQAVYDAGVRNLEILPSAPFGSLSDALGATLSGKYAKKTSSLLEVPRHETNLYYNVSTPNDWLAEDHCLYPAGQWGYVDTYSALLARESRSLLDYLLLGDPNPLGFHQINVRAYDGTHSLLTDLLSSAMQHYTQLVRVPVVSESTNSVAQRVANRMTYDAARPGLTARLVTSGTSRTLQLSSARGAVIPITGLATSGSESYGGQSIAHVSLAAGGLKSINVQ